MHLMQSLTLSNVQYGHTKVFLGDAEITCLDARMMKCKEGRALAIQSLWRMWLTKKHFKAIKW